MHQTVTFVAKYFIVLSVLLVAWVFFAQPRSKKKDFVVVGLLSAAVAVLLAKAGSHFYYDPRPFVAGHITPYFSHGNDNGFPSDHTLLAGVLTFLGFRYSKKLGWALLFVALLVGMARVKAGVHHSIDVLGSFVIAAVSVWLVSMLVDRFGHKHKATYTAKKSHN
jgi:undecaprenyl-diphosphatase